MDNKEIGFDESKRVLLEMMEEIHFFCVSNNIRYSLAFGTLLGAIRHKGYIPWDDDVDIMMPLPDLLKFKKLFKSEKLKYVDAETDSQHLRPFSRIVHTGTYHKFGKRGKTYGICIDLYVVIGLPENEKDFFKQGIKLDDKVAKLANLQSIVAFHTPFSYFPGCSYCAKKLRRFLIGSSVSYESATRFYNICQRTGSKLFAIYDRDIFESIIELDFEGRKFCAISCYEYFLSNRYGDYMQLPPEKDRHPYHGRHYYWK